MAGKPQKITRTEAERICADVPLALRSQAVTLANSVLAMQRKIEQQIPNYDSMPLAQEVTLKTGETVIRQNPAAQEFRATVKDYATTLNYLKNILDEEEPDHETSAVDDLRKKFKLG